MVEESLLLGGDAVKPGEFVSRFGGTAQVHGIVFTEGSHPGRWVSPGDLDWPAAKAALDALIEAESGEWVELPSATPGIPMRITRDGTCIRTCSVKHDWAPMYPPDADNNPSVQAYRKGLEIGGSRAAKAAVRPNDDPIQASSLDVVESEEWVLLEHPNRYCARSKRIRPDGTDPQALHPQGWLPEQSDAWWVMAYRKGREEAQEEKEYILRAKERDSQMAISYYGQHQALREQVRELVEAVEAAMKNDNVSPYTNVSLSIGDWLRIREAAKAVQL